MRTLIGAAAAALLLAGAPLALAHQGNPNMRSEVTAVTPATDGVTVEVLNCDDRLELHNTSGKDVVVEGYRGEPYARVLADGTVAGQHELRGLLPQRRPLRRRRRCPKGLGDASRGGRSVSRSGRFEWHDHRMHWMGKSTPPQVKDEDARAQIFDWKVPIAVGGAPGRDRRHADWVPLPGGGAAAGLIWISALVLIALCSACSLLRRRRDRPAAAQEPAEAW